MLAPMASFLADEAWEAAGETGSVHQENFLPRLNVPLVDLAALFELRDKVFLALEAGRKEGLFTTNGTAKVELCSEVLLPEAEMKEFLGVHDLYLNTGPFKVAATASSLEKCPRCWNHAPNVSPVCVRCAMAVDGSGEGR